MGKGVGWSRWWGGRGHRVVKGLGWSRGWGGQQGGNS